MSTEVTVRDNGPLVLRGEIALKDPEGGVYDLGDKPQLALCRCGRSANKPFCDGSHKEGFESQCRAPAP